jgi:hypothetical protein
VLNSPIQNAIAHEVEIAVSNTKWDLLAILIDSKSRDNLFKFTATNVSRYAFYRRKI